MASRDTNGNLEVPKPFESSFTFEWEIENFAMLAAQRVIGYLDSPIFRIGILKDSCWYLRLLTNSFWNPTCMLFGNEIFSGSFEFRVRIEILSRTYSPEFSYTQHKDHVRVCSQSPKVLFNEFGLYIHRLNYQMPRDWPKSVFVKCTVWELPYSGVADPRIRNLPEQPLSYDWQDLSFMSSPNGEERVRTCRPHISRGYTQVDVFEKTVVWKIERFLARNPEYKRSLCLESGFGDPCPLIITLQASGESGTEGDLMVELRRDDYRVNEFLLVGCRILVDGSSRLIFPWTTRNLDSLEPWILHTDYNVSAMERNADLTLRFELWLTLKNAEHFTKSTFFLWGRSPLDPVQDFKEAMKKLFDKQELESFYDVKLKSWDGRVFNCHKVVLAARSPVFASRFHNGDTDFLLMDDVHSDTLKRLLRFVYAAVLERLDVDKLLELYSAASAYKLSSLMRACMNRLEWMITRNNIDEIKKVAEKCEDKTLSDRAEKELTLLSAIVDS